MTDMSYKHITEIEEAQSNIDRIKTKFQAEMKDLVATYHAERLAHAAVVEKLQDEVRYKKPVSSIPAIPLTQLFFFLPESTD